MRKISAVIRLLLLWQFRQLVLHYWLKKLFSKVIVPVNKTSPNPINKNPEILSINNNFVLIFEKKIRNLSIAIAEIKNGIANPAEYIPSRVAPVITDELVAAIANVTGNVFM